MEFLCSVITFEDSSKQMPSYIPNLHMQLSFHTSVEIFSSYFFPWIQIPKNRLGIFGVHGTGVIAIEQQSHQQFLVSSDS
jgi:hypothetical protein